MTTSRHSVEQEEVMAYLDGELALDRASAAAAHLEHCRECQALADDFRKLSQQMMEWEVESSDPRVLASVSAALYEPASPARAIKVADLPKWRVWLSGGWIRWAGGLAALALLLVAIQLPLQRNRYAASRWRGQADGMEDRVRTKTVPPAPSSAPAPKVPYGFSNGGRNTVGGLTRTAPIVDGKGLASEAEVDDTPSENSFTPQGPMIIRTAALTLVAQQKDFDSARNAMDEILKRHHGFFGELTAAAPQNGARSIKATLRVPADQLDVTMSELKKLGRVESETQGGEEVTSEYIDLEARLANARHTEQRLAQIQAQRTGKLADVLKVEVEIARVRGEIEQMEAQRKSMRKQVDFATIDATLNEEYKAPLQSVAAPSTSTQFHNAFVEGYRNVADGVVALLLFLISFGPTLLIWGALLFFVGRFVWKKVRRTTVN